MHFLTATPRSSTVGQARPIDQKEIARLALNVTGGGFNPSQVALAMDTNRMMVAGKWWHDTGAVHFAIVKVGDA